MTQALPTASRRRGAVTVVGSLIIISSLVNIATAVLGLAASGALGGIVPASWMQDSALADPAEMSIVSVFLLSLACVSLITGAALLRMQRWAWALEMALVSLILLLALLRFFDGQPNYLSMAVNAFIAFAMNQQEVRDSFGVGRQRDGQLR